MLNLFQHPFSGRREDGELDPETSSGRRGVSNSKPPFLRTILTASKPCLIAARVLEAAPTCVSLENLDGVRRRRLSAYPFVPRRGPGAVLRFRRVADDRFALHRRAQSLCRQARRISMRLSGFRGPSVFVRRWLLPL